MKEPLLLTADKNNTIYDLPNFLGCGMEGNKFFIMKPAELIPLPAASEIFFLPNRSPVGYNTKTNKFQEIVNYAVVCAFLPPGFTQLYTPAYVEKENAQLLPLFAYTPVVWFKNNYYTPAVHIDKRKVHNTQFISPEQIRKNINKYKNTKNRLIEHLKNCALVYRCPNAINFFIGRYECPLPVSPSCNSACKGCISYQPEDSCFSTQERIKFVPTPGELAEVALIHIKNVKNPVLSFGQGCEGEPLLAAEIISEAIKLIRKKTKRGTININTNGSLTDKIVSLCKNGLDSLRVSLNSTREKYYTKYYAPKGYKFNNVIESIIAAKKMNKFVSINYLTMPGFTDEETEFNSLKKLIKKTSIDMIQWRNLNYDPQRYFKILGRENNTRVLGIKNLLESLKKEFPKLKHGYFNLPKEKWSL